LLHGAEAASLRAVSLLTSPVASGDATPWATALASVAVVTLIPLLAVAALAIPGRPWRRVLPGLVSFGAGALIGAAVFHLLPEAYGRLPVAGLVAVFVATGMLGSYGIEKALHRWQDTHHEAPPVDPGTAAFDDPSMVALNFGADALHNFVDGALIAAAFLAGNGPGLATALAMLAHELPRELGTFGVFVHYGTPPRRAVWFNAASGALAFAGAILTIVLGARIATVASFLIPVAAGSFLFVGGTVLVSRLKVERTWELPLAQLTAFGAGLALSALAALAH
jgi:zinc and cadmium transporter